MVVILFFSKERYEDEIAFIVFCEKFNNLKIQGNSAKVEVGVLLQDLALATYQAGLSGVETFYDVPASVGGALIMNAGAYGDEIYTLVKSVRVLDLKTKKLESIKKLTLNMGIGIRCLKTIMIFVYYQQSLSLRKA